MKKFLMAVVVAIFVSVLFSNCKINKNVCMDCIITIAGIEDTQPTFCGDRTEVSEKEDEYQEIVDRENSIVGQSAKLDCEKYYE